MAEHGFIRSGYMRANLSEPQEHAFPGIFPFLALPRELRDDIYDYATTYTKPIPDEVVSIYRTHHLSAHTDPREYSTFDNFTGLVLTCRQVYSEYHMRHKRSNKLSVSLKDVNDYIATFFPLTKQVSQELALTVHEDHQANLDIDAAKFNILPLITWSLRDSRLNFEFGPSNVDPPLMSPYPHTTIWLYDALKRRAADLNKIVSRTILIFSLDSHLATDKSPLSRVTLSSAWVSWSNASRCEIEILVDAEGSAPWMDENVWQYTTDIAARTNDLDSGAIPDGYLSRNDLSRLHFCQALGLDRCSMRWDVRMGIAEEKNSGPWQQWPWGVSVGRTWQRWACGVLQDEQIPKNYSWAELFQGENTYEDDSFDEGELGVDEDEDHECENEEDEENESEDEEDENIGEELREELTWLRHNAQLCGFQQHAMLSFE